MRLALECRRRIKEQQKRIGSAEFRNTHFSYQLGTEGVERFVVTPEVQSEDEIGADPLPPGQVWAISPGGQDEGVGLFRVDVNATSPGSGVRITNVPVPGPFRESVRYGEQNLLTRTRELVGDRDPASTNTPCSCAPSTPRGAVPISGFRSCLPSAAPRWRKASRVGWPLSAASTLAVAWIRFTTR